MPSPDELLLGIDLDAPEVERKPLANGINPWKRVLYDPAAMYAQELERFGVDVTCEGCGRTWKVHPMLAKRTHACSTRCRSRAFRARQRGQRPERPKWNNHWRPETYRKKAS